MAKPIIHAARLNRRIVIRAPQRTPDTAGGYALSWSTHATLWARVEERRGKEKLETGKDRAEQRYRFTIRHRSDLDTGMQVLWNGLQMDIESLRDPDGKGEVTEIDAIVRT